MLALVVLLLSHSALGASVMGGEKEPMVKDDSVAADAKFNTTLSTEGNRKGNACWVLSSCAGRCREDGSSCSSCHSSDICEKADIVFQGCMNAALSDGTWTKYKCQARCYTTTNCDSRCGGLYVCKSTVACDGKRASSGTFAPYSCMLSM
jgi:hypothetical protein